MQICQIQEMKCRRYFRKAKDRDDEGRRISNRSRAQDLVVVLDEICGGKSVHMAG